MTKKDVISLIGQLQSGACRPGTDISEVKYTPSMVFTSDGIPTEMTVVVKFKH